MQPRCSPFLIYVVFYCIMRKFLFLICLCCCWLAGWSVEDPVLMRINGKEILRSDFLFAYQEYINTVDSTCSPEKYVEEFVFYRLQIDEAKKAQMDTIPEFLERREEIRKSLLKKCLLGILSTDSCLKNEHLNFESVKVRQIFRKLPQMLTDNSLSKEKNRMDSIYAQLMKGQEMDFDSWVDTYSDDTLSYWLNPLQMTAELKEAVTDLEKGEVSRPFFTPEGLHIVKVIDRRYNELPDHTILTLVQKKSIVEQLKNNFQYIANHEGISELLMQGSTSKRLFSIGQKEYTGEMFNRFAASCPFVIRRQLELFIGKSLLDYVDDYLEQLYPVVKRTLQMYDERYLLAEIRRLKLEIPSMNDRVGWATYFKFHQSDYRWSHPKYKGIVVRCIDKNTAKEVKRLLKKIPEKDWKNILLKTFNTNVNRITVEQGLFADGENECVDELIFKTKEKTIDLSYPFTVLKGRKKKKPDDYREVLHQVQKDYRDYLEICWKRDLMDVAKVEINEEVLKTVNNN